jgi:hypothetical protein
VFTTLDELFFHVEEDFVPPGLRRQKPANWTKPCANTLPLRWQAYGNSASSNNTKALP